MTEVTLTELDRTLYELVRLKLVAMDLLPDITLYDTAVAYEAAKKHHVELGKKLVEVYGVGSSEARDQKQSHRIVIERKATAFGTLGGGTSYHEPMPVGVGQTPRFKKKVRPDASSTVTYEVRLITNSTVMDRTCTEAIYGSLGMRRYTKLLTGVELGNKTALLVYGGDTNVSSTDFTEKLFIYSYPDVWLSATGYVEREVSAMTSVTFSVGMLNSANEANQVLFEKTIEG